MSAPDSIDRRLIRTHELLVEYKKWNLGGSGLKPKDELRMQVDGSVTMAIAEDIIGKLLKEQFAGSEFQVAQMKQELENGLPSLLRQTKKNTFEVGFLNRSGGWVFTILRDPRTGVVRIVDSTVVYV